MTHIVLVSVIILYHMQSQVNQFLKFLRVISQLLFILLIYVPTYNMFNHLQFQQEMYKIFTRYLYFPKISRIIIKLMLIMFKCYSSLYFIFKIK